MRWARPWLTATRALCDGDRATLDPPPPVPSSRQDVEGLMHDMQRRYLVPMQREVRQ